MIILRPDYSEYGSQRPLCIRLTCEPVSTDYITISRYKFVLETPTIIAARSVRGHVMADTDMISTNNIVTNPLYAMDYYERRLY